VLEEFRAANKLVLGICNGFQILLKTNLLAAPDTKGPTATLTLNDSGKFEARWVRLSVEANRCVFLQGIREMELPVAHGEGKFVVRDEKILAEMQASGRLVMRYASASSPDAVPYPANPNGAMGDVAGICDETGHVFGLMPHPERFVDPTQHPRWTREPEREAGDGLRVFQNAVRYFL
jgi:phosphoribosylformylglycinamidine synthase